MSGEANVFGVRNDWQRSRVRDLGVQPSEQDHAILGGDLGEDEGQELTPLQTRLMSLNDGDRGAHVLPPMDFDARPGDRCAVRFVSHDLRF